MSDDPRRLRDEIALLTRSIDDARAEHARGEMDDAALAAVESRDGTRRAALTARLAEAEHDAAQPGDGALAAPDGEDRQRPHGASGARGTPALRRARRRRLVASCAIALAAAVGVVAVVVARPFSAAPAPVTLNKPSQIKVLLAAAELAVARRHPLQALTAYDAVLALDPSNPEAAIESGWLRYEAALGAHDGAAVELGAAQLRRAVARFPGQAAAHLYWGVVLFQRAHDRAGALAQVRRAAALPETGAEQSLTAEMLALLGS